jgi:hypothetical protein
MGGAARVWIGDGAALFSHGLDHTLRDPALGHGSALVARGVSVVVE